MYNRITYNCDGVIAKGILLGQCDFVEYLTNVVEEKKFWIFSSFKKIKKEIKFKIYLVFTPWKHAKKTIHLINEEDIISIDYCDDVEFINVDRYISKFTKKDPYYTECIIENFIGYKFVYEDNAFVANIRYGLGQYSLETLYNNLPNIIEEEFDEDTAERKYPIFITAVDREGQGTGFIELQYCKIKMPKKIALNSIKNWKKDSLYIGIESLDIFSIQYFDIFCDINEIDLFSPEYFTTKQVKKLRDMILERKPLDYKIIVDWLDICIEKGYSMYFLGV